MLNGLVRWGVLGAVALVALGVAYYHLSDALERAERAEATVEHAEAAVAQAEAASERAIEVAEQWGRRLEEVRQLQEQMAAVTTEARDQSRRIDDVLHNHNLAALAAARPGLVVRRVNDGTAERMQRLEQLTRGASPGGPGPTGEGGAASGPADPDATR